MLRCSGFAEERCVATGLILPAMVAAFSGRNPISRSHPQVIVRRAVPARPCNIYVGRTGRLVGVPASTKAGFGMLSPEFLIDLRAPRQRHPRRKTHPGIDPHSATTAGAKGFRPDYLKCACSLSKIMGTSTYHILLERILRSSRQISHLVG